MTQDNSIKYNIFKENDIELTKIYNSNTNISFYNQKSSFIKQSETPPSKIYFNFLISSSFNQVKIFYITIIKKKFPNIYYGFDSTAFCLLKYKNNLEQNKRYLIYGTLTKNKLYFIDCLKVEDVDYKRLCYMLL